MFGDMMGQMQTRQEELKKQLAEIKITEKMGPITVVVDANRKILDVSFAPGSDLEEVEDTLPEALNRALEKAMLKEAEESKKLINDMLPPGLGGLFGG